MSRLLLFVLLLYVILSCVSTKSCNILDKGDPNIRVIELDDSSSSSSTDSSETEVIELHLPDRRRRQVGSQEVKRSHCLKDDDCGPGSICIAHLACLKGRLRTAKSLELAPIETQT